MDFDNIKMGEWLVNLEDNGLLHPQYRLRKVNNEPVLLGTGGSAAVYEMYDKDAPEKSYAVKVIKTDEKSRQSIEDINKMQADLGKRSVHILRIVDTWAIKQDADLFEIPGEESCFCFILMEKLDCIISHNKASRVSLLNEALYNESEVISFAEQIGEAVKTAHEAGVIHRDIKLENVFYDSENRVYKLGDFGTARVTDNLKAETVVYTNGYGAPEIEKMLTKSYDSTVDIYSLGITLYLLLNNLRFPGAEGYRAINVQHTAGFVFPAPVNASPGMTEVIRKMCSFNPEDRYRTVDEVIRAIQNIGTEKETPLETGTPVGNFETEEVAPFEGDGADANDNSAYSRFNRKLKKELSDRKYRRLLVITGSVFSVLFAALLITAEPNAGLHFYSVPMWILPGMLILTAASRVTGEMKAGAVIATAVFGAVMAAVYPGISIPFIIIVVAVSACIPVCLGCALGTWIWMLLGVAGLIKNITLLTDYYFYWLFEIIIVSLFLFIIRKEAIYERRTKLNLYIAYAVCGAIFVLLLMYSVISLSLGYGSALTVLEETVILAVLAIQAVLLKFGQVPLSWIGDELVKQKDALVKADRELRTADAEIASGDIPAELSAEGARILDANDEVLSRAFKRISEINTAAGAAVKVNHRTESADLLKDLKISVKETKITLNKYRQQTK